MASLSTTLLDTHTKEIAAVAAAAADNIITTTKVSSLLLLLLLLPIVVLLWSARGSQDLVRKVDASINDASLTLVKWLSTYVPAPLSSDAKSNLCYIYHPLVCCALLLSIFLLLSSQL